MTLKRGRGQHRKYLPYAFTEQGVAMLSSVLNSRRAIAVNIEIMRAFVRLRALLGARTRLWLDGGGIFVIANLRGGGEFGESWHEQGALTHKQNVFDDFIAAAEHLIARRYTSPDHLAIVGGSNGGLLMGAAPYSWPPAQPTDASTPRTRAK